MLNARRLRAALLAGFLACSVGLLPARTSSASEAGWGIGSALSTIVYAPLKLAYATMGVVFGSIGWGLSGGDSRIMQTVIAPAVRGDYLVTPAHLRGERRLAFVGTASGQAEPARALVDPDEPEAPYGDAYPYEY